MSFQRYAIPNLTFLSYNILYSNFGLNSGKTKSISSPSCSSPKLFTLKTGEARKFLCTYPNVAFLFVLIVQAVYALCRLKQGFSIKKETILPELYKLMLYLNNRKFEWKGCSLGTIFAVFQCKIWMLY